MFINYFGDDERESPINLAVVRVLLGFYLLWKVLSVDWRAIYEWPAPLIVQRFEIFLVPEWLLLTEVAVFIVCTLLFIIGYRTRYTATIGALLLMHLSASLATLNFSGGVESMFIASYFMLFFGFYDTEDCLSIDQLRRTNNKTIAELNNHLKDRNSVETFKLSMLKFSLLVVGILYFGSMVSKAVRGPLHEWSTAENLGLFIAYRIPMYGFERPVAEFMLQYEFLLWAGAIGTIFLEGGLLIAILAGITLWPIILGLIGLHILIALSVGPLFLDQIIFFGMFLAWDQLYAHLAKSSEVDVVYDEHCYFCTQSLHFFPYLDIQDSITFYSQYTVPDAYKKREDVDFKSAIYLFRGEEAYRGYWAFREILRQFGVFAPFVWLMGLRPISFIGKRVYQYVADNRDRHFTCSVDPGN